MSAARVRVRFAPSPTGELHVGNARTALFNWIFARHCGGRFVLRIEDTDRLRTTRAFEESLLEDLRWLGIDWDEGPVVGGPFGPYRQAERLDLYRDCLGRLIAGGQVYPCYCSEAELDAQRVALAASGRMPRYTGCCRDLSDAQRRRLEAEGRPPVWRFRVEPGPIVFDDLVRGAMAFQGEGIGDFILMRSNGMPSYNFAVVIDDHAMQISHVIRGEDHLSNTASQLLLYRALGFRPPRFAHHALILGADHAKLSKRHGSISVGEFRRRGILPEVLLNALALLGSSVAGGREVLSAEQIIAAFSPKRIGKSGAIFDEEKLRWLNGMHIRRLSVPELTDRLLPFVGQAGYVEPDWGRSRIEAIVAVVQDSLATLADIGQWLTMFHDERYEMTPEALAVLARDESRYVLLALQKLLKSLGAEQANGAGSGGGKGMSPSFRGIFESLRSQTGLSGKSIFEAVRAAVTGRLHGPELERIFELLGFASLFKRLEKAIALGGATGSGRGEG
jgi:nondiscriminating glutamyl-tRNA synthetase